MAIRVQWTSRGMPNLRFYRSQLVQRTSFTTIQSQTVAMKIKSVFSIDKRMICLVLSRRRLGKGENRPARLRVWAEIPGIGCSVAPMCLLGTRCVSGITKDRFRSESLGLNSVFLRNDSTQESNPGFNGGMMVPAFFQDY